MDLRSALRANRIEYRTNPHDSSEITICCLWCPDRGESQDTRFRLGINIAKNVLHCYNCGYKSRKATKAISYRLKLGDIDTGYFGGDHNEASETMLTPLPQDFELIRRGGKGHWHRVALDYLLKRGVTYKQIEMKGIGFSLLDKYAYRIIFPVYIKDEYYGFVARSFVDKQPRYMNTPGLRALYNFPKFPAEEVNISEGIFKCLVLENFFKVIRNMFPFEPKKDSIVLLGHSMTEAQETMIKKAAYKEVVLWPDPDKVGAKGFITVADTLSLRMRVTIPWPVPKKQVDELSFSDIEEAYVGRIDYNEGMVLQWQNEVARLRR